MFGIPAIRRDKRVIALVIMFRGGALLLVCLVHTLVLAVFFNMRQSRPTRVAAGPVSIALVVIEDREEVAVSITRPILRPVRKVASPPPKVVFDVEEEEGASVSTNRSQPVVEVAVINPPREAVSRDLTLAITDTVVSRGATSAGGDGVPGTLSERARQRQDLSADKESETDDRDCNSTRASGEPHPSALNENCHKLTERRSLDLPRSGPRPP